MTRYLFAAFALLLLSASVSVAQSLQQEEQELGFRKLPRPVVMSPRRVLDVGKSMADNTGNATLSLRENELVMENMEMEHDEMRSVQRWSASFSGTAKELVFQADGNLVVYDKDRKALWSAGVGGGSGDAQLAMFTGGVLKIFKGDRQIWSK